ENVPDHEVRRRATQLLALQSEIVNEFLGQESRGNIGDHERKTDDKAVDARLLRIGAIDTQWGRRLFIHVQVNGDTLKLFGSQRQLALALEDAGYSDGRYRIEEGVALNLPCRVTTKPSDDGRYMNVDALFPARNDRANGRSRR
ncbi:MAG TPA: hypothetical protein VFV19_19005, partial [Candidatus Polarisedimenticolaceae bacterium]|nr:hypothetical protein [Candidatus Polarisedimenticolaceae bacterium]